jgi:hypothetical protein
MIEHASHLDQIASRAQALYSRPTVAMEIVRLAEQPSFDADALKRCVEQDPALDPARREQRDVWIEPSCGRPEPGD